MLVFVPGTFLRVVYNTHHVVFARELKGKKHRAGPTSSSALAAAAAASAAAAAAVAVAEAAATEANSSSSSGSVSRSSRRCRKHERTST